MDKTTVSQSVSLSSGNTAATAAYYVSFVALGLTAASLGPTLPSLAEQAHTGLGLASLLFTARAVGYLLGSLLGGRLYDHVPGHRVQAAALFSMSIMMGLVPGLSKLGLLALVMGVLGFVEGTLDVGGNTLLVWVHREKVAPYMNGLHFFFGVGALLSPLIVAQALTMTGGIDWAYRGLALLLLPAGVWLACLPSPAIRHQLHEAQGGRIRYGFVALVMAFYMLNVGAEGSMGGWTFTYAQALKLGDQTTAAYLTSAFWSALTAGRLLAIPISARLHPRWILFGDLVVCVVSLGVIVLWPASYIALWIGVIGAGIGMASVFPATITLAERYQPITGRITGMFFVGASAGSMFFPWLIGQIFEPLGPPSAMLVILGVLVAALVMFLIYFLPAKESHFAP